MFVSAQEVIEIIEQRKNRGSGFEHFKSYMESIHNPHYSLKVIHVAGTNGKGSTTNYIRSVLQAGGYRVGTFTSPYMITHFDRIRINDCYIDEKIFLDITNTYYDSWMKWDLSMFEIDMCIACVYFQREQVDFCVFEVGLGGRLDFTNIVNPLVSVITNIGLDHMELLGDTYELIAREKAGIIKRGKALITAEEKKECLNVFYEVSDERQSTCIHIKPIEHIKMYDGTICFDYGDMKEVRLSSKARYQCYNAALAIETIHYLQGQQVIELSANDIYDGIYRAVWIGRYEVVQENPIIVLDGAHNTDGIHALCESLADIYDPIIIFSVLKDKNFQAMITELKMVSDHIIVTQLQHNQRALAMEELYNQKDLFFEEDFDMALNKAKEFNRPIVITGSLYFISDVRKRWFS